MLPSISLKLTKNSSNTTGFPFAEFTKSNLYSVYALSPAFAKVNAVRGLNDPESDPLSSIVGMLVTFTKSTIVTRASTFCPLKFATFGNLNTSP